MYGNLLSMYAAPRRMIFCISLMLLAPGIFPKFWSIPPLISPSAPTITGTVSVLIPHILLVSISSSLYFESFSKTFVDLFRSDGTDTSRSLQHHHHYYYYYYYYYSFSYSKAISDLPQACLKKRFLNYFLTKGFALDLILKVWVFRNRKWSILTFAGVKSYFCLFYLYFQRRS